MNRKREAFQRRVLAMRQQYGMKWTRRQTVTLINRLMHVGHREGIDNVDLRSLVRLYNRELIGAKQCAEDIKSAQG